MLSGIYGEGEDGELGEGEVQCWPQCPCVEEEEEERMLNR